MTTIKVTGAVQGRRAQWFTALSQVGLVALASFATASVGCGGDKPAENPQGQQAMNGYPQQGGQYPQQGGQYPQQGGQYPQQPPPPGYPGAAAGGYPQQGGQYPQQPGQPAQPGQPGTATPGQPGAPAQPGAAGGFDLNQLAQAGAAMLGGGAAAGGALGGDPNEAGLKVAATKFAPGMAAEGSVLKQTLQEGGSAEMMVTMQPGKCYTIIGFSAPGGVKNLSLTLLAPPFYNMPAGASGTPDNVPVVGKSPNPTCPLSPIPLQYKVAIVAKSGGGPIAVQAFSKSK